jgi:hypothetical protein
MHPPKKIVFFLFLKTPGRSIMLGYFCTINDYDNAVASSFQVSARAGHRPYLFHTVKLLFLSAESQLSQDHKQCSIGAATCDSRQEMGSQSMSSEE